MRKAKSLVASLVAIVICFAMLIGSTYAWFTDSVINTNNIIKSGNIKVELWHNNDSKADNWGYGYSETNAEQVNSTTRLFLNVNDKEMLWEPNASVGENFRIKNVGTLALKYEFRVRSVAKTIAEDGKSLTDVVLMQAIQFDYSGIGAPGGLAQYDDVSLASDFYLSGTLLPNEVADYHISLDWFVTENDNDYMNMEMLMGVELIATQVSYEVDGMGNGYDSEAQFPNVSSKVEFNQLPAGESAVLETKGDNPVEAVVSSQLIEALPEEITSIALAHTEAIVKDVVINDEVKSAITFESIELVDQNGQIIDLEELGIEEDITVTLPAQPQLAGMPIDVYHDGEFVATVNVGNDGVITYTVSHFCEVSIYPNFAVGSIFKGVNPATMDERLAEENSATYAINYTVDGETYYIIADRATTRVFASTDTVYEQVNQNYTVETIGEGKLWEQFNLSYAAKAETTMVYMLPGTYKSGTTIDISSSVDIIGLGDRDTVKVIKTSASSRHLFNCAVQKAEYGEITLKNLYLDATVKTTGNKDNGAVQAIRKTKVKCYDLTIVKDPSSNDACAFYLNAANTNSYDGNYYNAYLYIENCRTNVKNSMYVVDGSGKGDAKAILQYNGLTYGANFDTTFTNTYIQGGQVTIGAMAPNNWWN